MTYVKTAGEAYYLAAEMERRAVRLYERALLLFDKPVLRERVAQILADEREHLRRFTALKDGEAPDAECGLCLSAESARILFSGGLMKAHRLGAFESECALLLYAAHEEQSAVEIYRGFAEQFHQNDACTQAFLSIAAEEQSHLDALNARIAADDAAKEGNAHE